MTRKRSTRGKGEGSVYQRSDGYWCGAVEAGRYPNGQRRKVRVVRKHKRDVLAALDDVKRQVGSGVIADRTATVEGYVTWWLDNVKARNTRQSSMVRYRSLVRNHITPAWPDGLGNVRLNSLTTSQVDEMLTNRTAQGLSPAMVSGIRGVLVAALNDAVKKGMLSRNVASYSEAVEVKRHHDPFTREEKAKILAHVAGDSLEALYVLALQSGMRPGELLALQWADVDLKASTVTVQRDTTKTDAGVRTIPLVNGTADALRARRLRSIGPALVFTHDDGTAITDKRNGTQWHRVLKGAGVRDRNFHQCRHTFAYHALEDGVPLEVVSKVMGHASIKETMDTYGSVSLDRMRATMEAHYVTA